MSSPRRKPGSSIKNTWIPAFAGKTDWERRAGETNQRDFSGQKRGGSKIYILYVGLTDFPQDSIVNALERVTGDLG